MVGDRQRFLAKLRCSEKSVQLRQLDLTQQPEQTLNWEVFETQKKQIQEALNAQTYHQFSAYAQQQFPGQPEQGITVSTVTTIGLEMTSPIGFVR
nr:Dsec\GM22712-PA [Haemonchus contortus]